MTCEDLELPPLEKYHVIIALLRELELKDLLRRVLYLQHEIMILFPWLNIYPQKPQKWVKETRLQYDKDGTLYLTYLPENKLYLFLSLKLNSFFNLIS